MGIPDGRYLTGFFSNYPTQETMDIVFGFVVEHGIEPPVAGGFGSDRLLDAARLQDEGGLQGKIVIVDTVGVRCS